MPDIAALEHALHQAVRDLADHVQPNRCPGCPTCDVLWLLIAGADDRIARARDGVLLP